MELEVLLPSWKQSNSSPWGLLQRRYYFTDFWGAWGNFYLATRRKSISYQSENWGGNFIRRLTSTQKLSNDTNGQRVKCSWGKFESNEIMNLSLAILAWFY